MYLFEFYEFSAVQIAFVATNEQNATTHRSEVQYNVMSCRFVSMSAYVHLCNIRYTGSVTATAWCNVMRRVHEDVVPKDRLPGGGQLKNRTLRVFCFACATFECLLLVVSLFHKSTTGRCRYPG